MIQRHSILCASLLLLPVAGHAQQPDKNTLPVTKVPLAAAPPAIQFVALARERGPNPQKDWSDMQVTLWGIQPEREEAQAVRRCVLGRSHWNAAPLLDSPTLLRWQIPSTARGRGPRYSVKLLGIDYATFKVTELLSTRQAQAFGRVGDTVYLNTSDGQSLLNVGSGVITKLEPALNVLAKHGADWLVEVEGQVARFDAAKSQVMRRYQAIKANGERQMHDHVDWDGGRFAVRCGRFLDANGDADVILDFMQPAIVYRELRVWDLQTGAESKVRVRMQARGGSGEPVIPMEMHTELVGGMFRYTERRAATGEHADLDDFDWERDAEWVTIDIASGKELLRMPYRPRDLQKPDSMDENRVPVYLRELFKDSPIRAWGAKQDLAYAFLTHKGIELELPTSGVCRFDAVCRTADGEQLLVLYRDTFYHCNLKAEAIAQWVAPAALVKANVELHAVTLR